MAKQIRITPVRRNPPDLKLLAVALLRLVKDLDRQAGQDGAAGGQRPARKRKRPEGPS